MRTIALVGKKAAGRVAMVDDEDYDLIGRYRWRVRERTLSSGYTDGPYALATFFHEGRRVDITMHKLLTGWPLTDHQDGDGLNNQRSNLRQATTRENNCNRQPSPGGSSRFKGVCWHKDTRKWQASISVEGKKRHLGLYVSEDEAAAAYIAASLAIQGEFAFAARGL